MKRVTQLGIAVLFGLSSGAALAGTTSQSASAATWHRGAPSALKGTWRTNYYRTSKVFKSAGYYTRTTFFVGSTGTDGVNDFYSKGKKLVESGSGWGVNHSLRWRYLGNHYYRLESKNGSTYDMIYTMYVRGHKAKISNTGTKHVYYKIR
ncbi:hypothetical protein AYR62_13245 [Secundilactobacillus paracollinoides]|uniref:hypothetical protein n=1 Tax=Secundilactobacillus paracollinoides TaxID=240427 RepID=UPI00081A601B|nr:hypothetical protein [Secundilactobacillus paracollinoides]ANZ64943.1 hypothetical protein AYR62_13245 [Secundilactobacillus paracollinoides]